MSVSNSVLSQQANESFGTLYDLDYQPITDLSQIQPDKSYLFVRHIHSSKIANVYFSQENISPIDYQKATKVETITILDKNPNIFALIIFAVLQSLFRSKGTDDLVVQQLTKVKDNNTNKTKNMGMIKFRNTCLFSVS